MWAAHFVVAQSTLSSPIIAGRLFPAWMAVATVASPLLEYGLIRFVSGVPILEVRPPTLRWLRCLTFLRRDAAEDWG